jgi:seryl-tRNA(Sec) selenium transferase
MKFPNNFRQFFPTETVKQVSQFIGNPKLAEALRDAAEKAGFKDTFSNSSLQPIQQVFENASRWMENITKQFTDGSTSDLVGVGINGTGELFSPRWLGVPLSSQQSLMLAGSIRGAIDASHLTQELSRFVCSKTGAQEVLFVNSLVAALASVVTSTSRIEGKSKWILPRQNCIRVPRFGDSSVGSLRDILDDARVEVVEVGTNQDCDVDELVRVLGEDPAFAVSLSLDSQAIPSQADTGSMSTRSSLLAAKEKNGLQIVELVLDGTVLDIRGKLGIGKCINQLWQDGIDIAIVPCEFLIGSTEGCMILFRDHSAIAGASRARIGLNGVEMSAASKLLLFSVLRSSTTYEDWEQTELGQILTTSSENLLQRAQRMAKQLEGSSLVRSAEAISKSCRLGSGVWAGMKLESGCVRIFPKTGNAKDLAASLLKDSQPIWCNVDQECVEIVLRTMSPDDDLALIQRFCESRQESDVRTESES